MEEAIPAKISVVVPYYSNQHGLAVTLVGLQSQLVIPERIIVIDTSPDKSGLEIAKRYMTHNVPIIVECAQVPIYEAWNRGIELSGGTDVLIINDDLLFPQNLIDVLQIARASVPALCFVPHTPPRDHAMPMVKKDFGFDWYAPIPTLKDYQYQLWMPGFCFLLTKEAVKALGSFDTKFQIWYGDTDYEYRLNELEMEHDIPAIMGIDSLRVWHFGGTSYEYKSDEVKYLIQKDRVYYEEKHKE